MIDFEPAELAGAAGAELLLSVRPMPADAPPIGPSRAVIDSRQVGPGDLFFGLTGENLDGGRFAAAAIEAGCWGVVVGPRWAADAVQAARAAPSRAAGPVVLAAEEPLVALQNLARAWRQRLGEDGAMVTGITGSVGKTSTKDIARAVMPRPVHASAENLNTEIGLPLSLLEAPRGVRSVVLEMAMRGSGQIADLSAIAEPDIGAITNVGPVHTELLGSIEAVAAAKAELLSGLKHGAWAVVPAEPGPLAPFVEAERERLRILRFGPGGDIEALEVRPRTGVEGSGLSALIRLSHTAAELAKANGTALSARFDFPFDTAHNLLNATAAIALGLAAGGDLETMASRAGDVSFSRLRGERLTFGPGFELVNDCYNANPISMRAALDHLGAVTGGRRIAVLGPMAELGPDTEDHHMAIGEYARERQIDLLVGVGPKARWYRPDELVADPAEAAELLAGLAGRGDTVLVKGSRSAGLEAVSESLALLLERPEGDGQTAAEGGRA